MAYEIHLRKITENNVQKTLKYKIILSTGTIGGYVIFQDKGDENLN